MRIELVRRYLDEVEDIIDHERSVSDSPVYFTTPRTRRVERNSIQTDGGDEADHLLWLISLQKNKLLYQVSWVGYPDELTWIPEADME